MKFTHRLRWSCLSILILLTGASVGAAGFDRTAAAETPVYVGILIQDDVTGSVGTDLKQYRNFVTDLPAGSQVMIGYSRVGRLDIRQDFTPALSEAALTVRPPAGLPSLAPGSAFQSLKEFVRMFPEGPGKKVLVFVGDGVDRYAPSQTSPSQNTILLQAIRAARERGVEAYSIYAPTTLTDRFAGLRLPGQGALNYLAENTGGKAFFTGSTYITAKSDLAEILTLIR